MRPWMAPIGARDCNAILAALKGLLDAPVAVCASDAGGTVGRNREDAASTKPV